MRPPAPRRRTRRGHPERVDEAREEHTMSMWETPVGLARGDDIALTTPTNADVP